MYIGQVFLAFRKWAILPIFFRVTSQGESTSVYFQWIYPCEVLDSYNNRTVSKVCKQHFVMNWVYFHHIFTMTFCEDCIVTFETWQFPAAYHAESYLWQCGHVSYASIFGKIQTCLWDRSLESVRSSCWLPLKKNIEGLWSNSLKYIQRTVSNMKFQIQWYFYSFWM